MATVNLDQDLAIDLINTKLKVISQEIENILTKWQYTDATLFIQDAKNGTLEEAEDDAISLRHLLDTQEELFAIKGSWNT